MFREIFVSTIFMLHIANSQDVCKFSPIPIPKADFFACREFQAGREPIHSVELSCPGSRISVGKLELGYRDRQCKDQIGYIGCCFGAEIPRNASIVCVSRVDIVGTTNNLLRARKTLTSSCESMESCKIDLSLSPFIDPIYDVYSVFVRVFYDCIGDEKPQQPKESDVSIIGWIVAGILTVLLLATIIVIVVIYHKKIRNEVNRNGARPLPTLPGPSGTYTTLSQRRTEEGGDYDRLTSNGSKLEDSDYHEYLEPIPDVIKQHDDYIGDQK